MLNKLKRMDRDIIALCIGMGFAAGAVFFLTGNIQVSLLILTVGGVFYYLSRG